MQPLIRQLQVMNTQLNTFMINNVIENKNNYNCTKISAHVYNFFLQNKMQSCKISCLHFCYVV